MFDPDDYPSHEGVMERFSIRYRVFPFPDESGFLFKLGREKDDELAAKLRAENEAIINDAVKELWSKLAEQVAHISERLTPNDDGSSKVFHASMIENLRETVAILPKLNITGNADLERMRQDVLTRLCGHDADKLKAKSKTFDANAARDTRAAADDILRKMSGYLGGNK